MDYLEIHEYLLDFQKRALPELVDRKLGVNKSNKIKSIIYPRRLGKTLFLFKKIGELVASGVEKERILYLNFEDPGLMDAYFKEIRYPFQKAG